MILLLVEDEPYTREGILNTVDWDSLGITRVFTAEDGKKGLEMAQKYSPDIVLTDMYMPKMDGADMAKGIREILPDCALIFMSGYSDITYYKSAVQVSALEFVNKPLVVEELVKVLRKSVNHVKSNKDKKNNYSIFKGNELAGYVIYENADPDKLMNLWNDYGMPYGEKYALHTIIFRQSNADNANSHIHKLAKETGINVAVCSTETGYVIHTAIPCINGYLLNRFSQRLLNKNNNEATYLAIGKPVNHPLELRDSYSDAASLMKLSFFYPDRRMFTYGETAASLVNEDDCIHEIIQLLCCDPAKAKQLVETQFEKIRQYAGTPIELVKYWGFRMCTESNFQFNRIKEDNKHSIPAEETELWDKISSINTLDALKQLVLETIDRLDCSRVSDENSPIIWKVQRYIYNHFSEPLSLKALSEHVNLSTTYLCSFFKDRTGQTINSYILDVRIHRAKLLLEASNMHINEIADASGFSSSSYFIKAFRKITGMTPQIYRKEYKRI